MLCNILLKSNIYIIGIILYIYIYLKYIYLLMKYNNFSNKINYFIIRQINAAFRNI